MPAGKSSFLDKVMGRLNRLDAEGLQTVVQRLARERRFLETLFNTIEDGVMVTDAFGRIVYFNSAVTRLLGVQPESEGRHVNELLPGLDWKGLSEIDNRGGQNVVRREFEVTYPRERYLRLYAAPLDGESVGSTGMALILHDDTENRQRTSEAIESERIQALTLLAASVAHEIGNPLNALHIHLQLMEREVRRLKTGAVTEEKPPRPGARGKSKSAHAGDRDPARKLESYLEVCKGEIHRLDYIVTQFLQAIRPSVPQIKPSSLNETGERTLDLLRPELENRGLIVEARWDRHIPLVPMDAGQIQQALVNLIKNAMQAMTTGGTLTLQTGETTDGVWLSVSDTGCGIPQELISRIFEPYYTTKKKGSGLGLMIVQRIVRAHGGRIDLESQSGRGTSFRLWLPLHERKPRLLEAPLHD